MDAETLPKGDIVGHASLSKSNDVGGIGKDDEIATEKELPADDSAVSSPDGCCPSQNNANSAVPLKPQPTTSSAAAASASVESEATPIVPSPLIAAPDLPPPTGSNAETTDAADATSSTTTIVDDDSAKQQHIQQLHPISPANNKTVITNTTISGNNKKNNSNNNPPTFQVTTPPRISLPPGTHTYSEPAPQIGPGWIQLLIQRRTPSGPYGKLDRYYVTPTGRKLRGMNEVMRYLNNAAAAAAAAAAASRENANNNSLPPPALLRVNTSESFTSRTTTTTNNSSAANSPRNPSPSVVAGGGGVAPSQPYPTTTLPTSGPGSGKSIDTHPYSRGSVIEVLYVKRSKVIDTTSNTTLTEDAQIPRMYYFDGDYHHDLNANHWLNVEGDDESTSDWFGSDDDDESDDDDDAMEEEEEKEDRVEKCIKDEDNNGPTNSSKNSRKKYCASSSSNVTTTTTYSNKKNNNTDIHNDKKNVHLADVIDRIPVYPHLELSHPQQKFKYYIHYRDFNRRMDEWITADRIVSPPSVGNAKVRAMKRREERLRKEEEERKERERILNEINSRFGGVNSIVGVTGRASVESNIGDVIDGNGVAAFGDIVSNGAGVPGGGVGVGRKRLRRVTSAAVVDNLEDSAATTGGIIGGSKFLKHASSMGDLSDEPSRLTRRRTTVGGVGGGVGGGTAIVAGSKPGGAQNMITAEEHTAVDVVTTIAAPILDEHQGMDEAALKEHEEVTKIKNVNTLELGKYQMDTWYFSPLPKELLKDGGSGGVIDVLYVDEFSLNFFTRKEELLRYQRKTLSSRKNGTSSRRHPPGNEIYRCGNLSMFEVDGFEERLYCQNLCYIAKLFLDHKTLYFDVDPFLFYVLCEVDERGYHPVGYYSKEKYSDVGYNLACILTFPSHQRKGYGRFLIAFSYELSKKEEKVGSPEKPMSDLGQQAYIPYWTSTILDFLLNHSGDCKSMSIMDIAKKTSIMAEDIIFALNTLGLLKFVNGVYFIYAEWNFIKELAKKHPVKEPRVDPSKLHWTPYITDVKRDKFSLSSKKPSLEADAAGDSVPFTQ